ncbi:MAG TPA: formate dehydrogenase accessory sulfurtransferase FdhD [Nakamurella sp.]
MSRVAVRTPIVRYRDGSFSSRSDTVSGEEPLELRIGGKAFTTTMRTPGADIELAHGLLHAEGVITAREDVLSARYCSGVGPDGRNTYNVLEVNLSDPAAAERVQPRTMVTNSACGVCGAESIDAITRISRYRPGSLTMTPATISALPDHLRARQRTFRLTGGLHACALATPDGLIEEIREDVGRHNAMDKVIGAALLADRLPLTDRALLTSSRASFELVQKATLAGVGMLIAVSAPSSLAVQLAEQAGLTLIGFTSATGFNIYTGAWRVSGATER